MNRLELFPDTTTIENDALTIAGCDLFALADEYGTPLYLYDRATLDASVTVYRRALNAHYGSPKHGYHYPAESGLTYAGKAFLCLAIAQWSRQQDLWLDCSGLGEIAIAVAAGVPREHIVVHGVNKSPADLEAAIRHAGIIVIDNLTELERLVALATSHSLPNLWLRFQPGLAVETHAYTQTGQADSKFGMGRDEIIEAARICRQHELPLKGLHFHQGSQFRDPSPLGIAIEKTLDLAQALDLGEGWVLSPGGGWGVAYNEDDLPQPDVTDYVCVIAEGVKTGCRERGLPLPRLQLEPGRSLVARAGVALYRLGALKRTAQRTWLLLDGGLADNPRPALYGARYSALPAQGPERSAEETVWMAGPYCESGDVLIAGLPFPKVAVGELIAIPVSGAYHLSMSSNYNGARRPAVLWLDNGHAYLVQSRETPADLLRRDCGLPANPVEKG
ncbi:MAG: diaminopimelate decarboxylase [Anaerolineae bacterium CG_4_9_14_0_8_um_filter_58_9]|nr:MAG: diaminopimelate decarboxylase [Anaerolineae bacterium CG06_land_8_20_14_3_00_57_67]PJH74725.1 MAG: diaminopimelate decarboxylase [Anaerolineae bacterium CG_4_9_14_0_8_um_filter_58_9]